MRPGYSSLAKQTEDFDRQTKNADELQSEMERQGKQAECILEISWR